MEDPKQKQRRKFMEIPYHDPIKKCELFTVSLRKKRFLERSHQKRFGHKIHNPELYSSTFQNLNNNIIDEIYDSLKPDIELDRSFKFLRIFSDVQFREYIANSKITDIRELTELYTEYLIEGLTGNSGNSFNSETSLLHKNNPGFDVAIYKVQSIIDEIQNLDTQNCSDESQIPSEGFEVSNGSDIYSSIDLKLKIQHDLTILHSIFTHLKLSKVFHNDSIEEEKVDINSQTLK